jgi:hypothetical protein
MRDKDVDGADRSAVAACLGGRDDDSAAATRYGPGRPRRPCPRACTGHAGRVGVNSRGGAGAGRPRRAHRGGGRVAVPRGRRARARCRASGTSVIFCGAPAHAARLRLNRVPSMVRRIAFLVLLVWTGCAAHALAQQVPGFRLAKQLRIEVTGDHYHLEGQVELEQGEQKFYADVVDYYHDTRRMVADRQRGLRGAREPDRRRPARVRSGHQNGHVLQRVGVGIARREGRQELLRHPGTRRAVLRRDHREDRAAQVQDHGRRLHQLRAADTSLGTGGRHHDGRTRTLRVAHQHRAEGEGRAALLPARDVLPHPERRPRHRLPAAHLRIVDCARPERQQRVLLGHQPQPGRHGVPRLVHASVGRARAPSTATWRARDRRARSPPTF